MKIASLRRTGLVLAAIALALPAQSLASSPQNSGPAASYSDDGGDATPTALDITRVDFGPNAPGSYLASMTFASAPQVRTTYISAGYFSTGNNCQMYHILYVGQNAYANLFCGVVGSETNPRVKVGSTSGGRVTVSGNTLSAEMSNSTLPAQLEASGNTLTGLFSWSCPEGGRANGNGCKSNVKTDVASAPGSSFVVRLPLPPRLTRVP